MQEAFSHLLGDATELTQEMASRGMSIVYSRGDDAMRSELLASLTGTLQGAALTAQPLHTSCCPSITPDPVVATFAPNRTGCAKCGGVMAFS